MFASRFHEEGPVPSDAEQVGTTWAKANKDGSPDKHFRDNYSIPVMRYATLTLRSNSRLNEEYMLSNVQSASDFEIAFARLRTEVVATGEVETRIDANAGSGQPGLHADLHKPQRLRHRLR